MSKHSISAVHDRLAGPPTGTNLFAVVGKPPFPFTLPTPVTVPIDFVGANGATITLTYGAGDTTVFNLARGASQTLARVADFTTAVLNADGNSFTISSTNPSTGIIDLEAVAL